MDDLKRSTYRFVRTFVHMQQNKHVWVVGVQNCQVVQALGSVQPMCIREFTYHDPEMYKFSDSDSGIAVHAHKILLRERF